MSQAPAPNAESDADRLEAAADQAIAACGGDAREAVKALLIANEVLERDRRESFAGIFARRQARSIRI
jgi:hypothetical protein